MPEHDAEAQLGLVLALARRVLGGTLLAVYLHGSAVEGGLQPDSDLDLLAIVDRPLTAGERRDLIAGLLRSSGRGHPSGSARSIELSVVRRDAVRPWRYPPEVELQYGDWWREELAAGREPWSSPNPDLAIAVAAALAADRPLLGPPAAALIDPVPASDLVRASVAGIDGLLADLESDTRNVLLTLARIWVTAETGAVVGKGEAARWAAVRLDPDDAGILLLAGDAYTGSIHDTWDDRMPAARQCAAALVAACRAARRESET